MTLGSRLIGHIFSNILAYVIIVIVVPTVIVVMAIPGRLDDVEAELDELRAENRTAIERLETGLLAADGDLAEQLGALQMELVEIELRLQGQVTALAGEVDFLRGQVDALRGQLDRQGEQLGQILSSLTPAAGVTAPAADTVVADLFDARGGSANIPAGHSVWLVVEFGNLWFPQLGPLIGDEWTVRTQAGGDDDCGRPFRLITIDRPRWRRADRRLGSGRSADGQLSGARSERSDPARGGGVVNPAHAPSALSVVPALPPRPRTMPRFRATRLGAPAALPVAKCRTRPGPRRRAPLGCS